MAPAGVWNGHARFTFFCKKTAVFASENPRLLLMQVCKDVQRQSVPHSRSAIQIFHCLELFYYFLSKVAGTSRCSPCPVSAPPVRFSYIENYFTF